MREVSWVASISGVSVVFIRGNHPQLGMAQQSHHEGQGQWTTKITLKFTQLFRFKPKLCDKEIR